MCVCVGFPIFLLFSFLSFSLLSSLLLLLPLLESQSRVDLRLVASTCEILSGFLNRFQPMSLQRENPECLGSLQRLLKTWLLLKHDDLLAAGVNVVNLASGLVALTAARGSLVDFIDTLHLLLSLPESVTKSLSAMPCVQSLRRMAVSKPLALLGTGQQRVTWPFKAPAALFSASEDLRTHQFPRHEHPVRLCTRGGTWGCQNQNCGFRCTKTTPETPPRYRCVRGDEGCEFDLCGNCMAEFVGIVSPSITVVHPFLYVAQRTALAKIGSGQQGSIQVRHERKG